jgi:hypothetical protein
MFAKLLGSAADVVLLAELVHASCRIQHFLFAGVERMALGTNFDVQRFEHGRAGFEFVATAASDINFFIFGMAFGFHGISFASAGGVYAD